MSDPKLQHYVPQFYLKGFADKDDPKSIWVYEKDVARPRRQGIKNTAAETYYYTITNKDDQKDHALETQLLAPIESAARPIVDSLLSERRPTVAQDDIAPLASFMTTLFARSPFNRKVAEQLFLGSVVSAVKNRSTDTEIGQFLDSNPHLNMSVKQVHEIIHEIDDPAKWQLTVRKDPLVALQFFGIAEYYPHFESKNFSVIRCSGDPEFLTCDSPLSVFVPDKDGRALVGVGIGQPTAEVVLPLSPNRALRLTQRKQPPHQRVSEDTVRDINRRLVYQAQRYVYASRNSSRLAKFIAGWFEKRQELTIDPIAMRAQMMRLLRRD